MIAKKFRLKEREVKKVMGKWKPFFSSGLVLNKIFNKLDFNRFAIIIWSKSVNTNVTRVFFRRKFYDKIRESKLYNTSEKYYDFVFVVKKQTKLDRKKVEAIKSFENDLNFLIKKVK
jgi:glucose-6-phosphate isomerase